MRMSYFDGFEIGGIPAGHEILFIGRDGNEYFVVHASDKESKMQIKTGKLENLHNGMELVRTTSLPSGHIIMTDIGALDIPRPVNLKAIREGGERRPRFEEGLSASFMEKPIRSLFYDLGDHLPA